MAQPVAYDRSALNGETYFTTFSTNTPSAQQPGQKLDQEFNAIARSLSQHAYNLSFLQRDDLALANGIVTRDSLSEEVVLGVGTPAAWSAGSSYAANASVIVDGVWYWADSAHSAAASFATDLGAGLWNEIYDFTDVVTLALLSTAMPTTVAAGVGTVGSASTAARADHSHPFSTPTVNGTANQINSTVAGGVVTLSLPSGLVLPGAAYVNALFENAEIRATGLTGTVHVNIASNAVVYVTGNASGDWVLNIRGDASTSLNSMMSTGHSCTFSLLVTQGGTAYKQLSLKVDDSTQTIKWLGDAAISAGVTNGIDIYTGTIIKTGAAAFTVLEQMSSWG